jgi:diguanylate cyclase (GGDEF)-like protein/PAS domain S-box-containing protein
LQFISKLKASWKEDSAVQADATSRLFRNNTASTLTGFVLAILFALAILKTTHSTIPVYIWLAIISIIYIVRDLIAINYKRRTELTTNIAWLNKFRITTAFSGIAWASSTVLLFEPNNTLNQSLILFTLTGICAGAALTYAIDYYVLYGFFLPISSAIFLRLTIEGSDISIIMSLMVALFIIFMIAIARKSNSEYVKNILMASSAIEGESREKSYSHIMELIANNHPIENIFDELVHSIEIQNQETLCSILLLESDGKRLKVASAKSLPDFYNQAIDGVEIGLNVGSCGTAAFTGQRQIAEDIQTHPNWTNYRKLAENANLRACWSEPIKDAAGKVLGTFAIYHHQPATPSDKDLRMITQNASLASIAIERSLNHQEQRLATLLYQNTNESMMITDKNNMIVAVNPAFSKDTGYSAEEVIGKNPNILSSGRHNEEFYKNLYQELMLKGNWQGEIWNRKKNGEVYAEWIQINTIHDSDGTLLNYVSLATDITERKISEEIIWKQANFDTLTGLPNRHMFLDRFQQEIKISQRANLPLALLFIDLDEFKDINDSLGHGFGDLLLKETAERLRTCVRESDTIAVIDSIARLGGDEFTIILTRLTDIDCIERIAERILKKIAEPYQLEGEVAYLTASIGITLSPNDAIDIDTLLKNADQAMYAAKRDGKNKFSYYTKSMQEKAQKRMRLSIDLRDALEKKEFHLVYQPIVNLRNSKVTKAEALIRWQHPTSGLVSPAEFIPIAENNGLIHDIGNWVFHTALAQVTSWRKTFNPNFQVSINKSPVQFQTIINPENTEHNWVNYLHQLGISGDAIAIEITEGLLLDSHQDIHQHLLDFRDAGIQVALDDFGTGYSSLSYLKKFDIDYIKIDQSFVQNIEHDSDNMVLCQAIIVMAHKLNLKVIAEGIETQEHFDLLKFAGCDFGQGYFFSKPLTASEFEDFMGKES